MEGGPAVNRDDDAIDTRLSNGDDAVTRARADTPIRILLVDDHEGIAESLTLALKAQLGAKLGSVRFAATTDAALQLIRDDKPDVVIMDVFLGEEDGFEAIRRIHASDDTIAVIVYTGMPGDELVEEARVAGASAFLSKRIPLWRLANTVRMVAAAAGDRPRMLVTYVGHPPAERAGVPRLSPRQLEVLVLMRGGFDARSIARQLGVSLNTARSHVKAILFKLEAHSQLEAVARATRLGILRR